MANEDELKKPFLTFTAYDEYGNELTSTIEYEVDSIAEAITLWQWVRKALTMREEFEKKKNT